MIKTNKSSMKQVNIIIHLIIFNILLYDRNYMQYYFIIEYKKKIPLFNFILLKI